MVYSNIHPARIKNKQNALCESVADIDGIAAEYLDINTYVNCFIFCCRWYFPRASARRQSIVFFPIMACVWELEWNSI